MCRKAIGRPGRPFSRGGKPLFQFASNSAFAERTVVRAVQAVKIPDDLPLTSAALIGCGVLTGVGAVLNRAKVGLGDTVVVIGTGGIGLNVLGGPGWPVRSPSSPSTATRRRRRWPGSSAPRTS